MDSLTSYVIALLFALLVHGLVIGLMMFNWESSESQFQPTAPYYIEASVVAENPHTAKKAREKAREISDRERRLQRRRQDEQNFIRNQKRWEEAQQKRLSEEALVQRQPEVVPEPAPRAPEPQSRIDEPAVDQEAVRSTFEEDLALAMVIEENMRRAVTDDEKAMAYVSQIQRDIIQNWSRPPSARNGMETLLRVHLVPTGEVVDVKVEGSSGNDAFDRSAILAVKKSERFVVPSDTLRFERNFREFTVLFRPDDLRL